MNINQDTGFLVFRNEQKKNRLSWVLATPVLAWLIIFFLVPYLIVMAYSFLTPTIFDVKFDFSLDAYRRAFEPIYMKPFLTSCETAFLTTLLCLLFGYPVAYFIARSPVKVKNWLLVLIIIPFWTNFIIRIFSWRIFLSANGALNESLAFLGLIHEPLRIVRTDFAVLLVMVYVYIPYMILPLYSVIERIDFTLLEAAKDLGANEMQAFLRVTLPLSKQGILAGVILVFIPALGAYLVPQLVGHQNSLYIGQVITHKIKNIPRNWPLAAALSFIMLIFIAFVLIAVYSYMKRRHERSPL